MKKNLHTQALLLIFMLLSSSISAQDGMVADINRWIQNGQYDQLTGLLADDVECTIAGRQYSDSKSSGKALDDMFRGKKIERYQVIHSGNNGNSTFLIANIAISDTDYRVNILIKERRIVELRIE